MFDPDDFSVIGPLEMTDELCEAMNREKDRVLSLAVCIEHDRVDLVHQIWNGSTPRERDRMLRSAVLRIAIVGQTTEASQRTLRTFDALGIDLRF